jgi:hypothetical protein
VLVDDPAATVRIIGIATLCHGGSVYL